MSKPGNDTPGPTVKPANAREEGKTTGGPAFWIGVVIGWTMIALGIRGLLHDHVATNPAVVGRYVLEAALILDLVVAPIACAAGLLIARLFKPPLRAIVGGGLVASVVIAVYSYPFVRGFGQSPNLPSALFINYGRGLVIVLALIWLVVATLCLVSVRRTHREASRATV